MTGTIKTASLVARSRSGRRIVDDPERLRELDTATNSSVSDVVSPSRQRSCSARQTMVGSTVFKKVPGHRGLRLPCAVA